MLEKNRAFRDAGTHEAEDYTVFQKDLDDKGGFYRAWWCGSPDCEEQVKNETKATIRCIPMDGNHGSGRCLRCGAAASRWVYFARAY